MFQRHRAVKWLAPLLVAAGMAASAAAGDIIGLCCREGTGGAVLEEVFKTEGVPYRRLRDLGGLERLNLKGLVLGEGFDDSADEVAGFLDRGGTLLCLRPAGRLAETLRLKEAGVQEGGYLTVAANDAATKPYQGRFQLFGRSRLYHGGESLARLSPKEPFGGVLRVKRGPGTALVAAFDLAETLLAIFQPESPCGKHIDASKVEYDLGDVPQADLLRRLLVGSFLASLDVPVMRKWYFPAKQRAVLVVVGDQDGADYRQLSVVLDLMRELAAPYTLFVTPALQPVTKQQFAVLRDGGMEFCLHQDFFKRGAVVFQEATFQSQLKKAKADVEGPMPGERSHSGIWESVGELPAWAERGGVQFNAILGDRWWPTKPPKFGYWVGTGLPYYFFHPKEQRRLDVLEIPIFGGDNGCFWKARTYHVRYKPGAHKTFIGGCGYTEDEAFGGWRRFFDQAIDEYPAAVGYCWHPVYLAARKLALESRFDRTDSHFRQCVRYAKGRGAGVSGACAWNDFWRAREKVVLEPVAWDAASATAQYRIAGDVKLDRLTLVVPAAFHGRKASICVDGRPADSTEADLCGQRQAMLTVDVVRKAIGITVQYR